MSSEQTPVRQTQSSSDTFGILGPAIDYGIDAAQRTVLFWDVMRQRGNQYREHLAQTVPHVLSYEAELIVDGRTLKRPVNYGLVRIVPPRGTVLDPTRRPFVVVDRARAMVQGLAGSRPTARSESPSKRGIPVISWAFCPIQCPARPSKTLRAPRRSFLKR
jgi:hypothetical protein